MADSPGSTVLEGRFVGQIEGKFFVPAYQRGYRWGTVEVTRLMDDIVASDPEIYYLQPIVVAPMDDGRWELIDGQQRLTTLFLILQFIHRNALPMAEARYSLEYETRERSVEYLTSLDAAGADQNIDFFHMHEAWNSIEAWFDAKGADGTQAAIDLYTALTRRVKIIWFEAPEGTEPTELFRRLNVGRIPLTDAELVKAHILSSSRAVGGNDDRTESIAAEWDSIERDLRIPELWAFLTGEAKPQATHIGLLLDTLAGSTSGRKPVPFETFETLRERISDNPKKFWDSVVDLHSVVMGWFEDRNLFHKIGFLIASGKKFSAVWKAAQGTGRSEFESKLDAMIADVLDLTPEALRELSYDKPKSAAKASKVLLLMNVETIRNQKGSSERYSFQSHATGQWSLEHIHAQNAEPLKTAEQWIKWLQLHTAVLVGLPDQPSSERLNLEARVAAAIPTITEETFHELEQELTDRLTQKGDGTAEDVVHSISNLALLDRQSNSALGNTLFEVKRIEILRRDREGSYIPVCTRNVFLKYYTDESSQQVHFWGAQDRSAYLEAIEKSVERYLRAAGGEEGAASDDS